jgi:hypothetical protein
MRMNLAVSVSHMQKARYAARERRLLCCKRRWSPTVSSFPSRNKGAVVLPPPLGSNHEGTTVVRARGAVGGEGGGGGRGRRPRSPAPAAPAARLDRAATRRRERRRRAPCKSSTVSIGKARRTRGQHRTRGAADAGSASSCHGSRRVEGGCHPPR